MQQLSPTDKPRKRGRPKGSTRNTQHAVTGAHGIYFTENSTFYDKSRNRIPLGGRCKNLIDLGPEYAGPVPPAYGGMGGMYIADPDHDRSEDKPRMTYDRRRRAGELVAFEIYGPPPNGWACPLVVYADGNPGNFAPANVLWSNTIHNDTDRSVRQLMVSDEVALKRFNAPSRGGLYRPHGNTQNMPDVFAHEQLDVSWRHGMVQCPPNRVHRWSAHWEDERRKAQDKLKAS